MERVADGERRTAHIIYNSAQSLTSSMSNAWILESCTAGYLYLSMLWLIQTLVSCHWQQGVKNFSYELVLKF
jgi:hypothetical protein